ncbi:adenosine deaminase-like [Hyalella azteca]|uniref:adenosine deaminase n=1 Tax=Hyalella azteca TaxID=294128 RepID=A0A8B7PF67_HYAAZ|nr:adenosine deaminase-like [Hyalella azteca]
MLVLHESIKKQAKCRVELHVHLDGALRPETAWDLIKQKGLPLPGDGSLQALTDALTPKEPTDLACFLKPFSIFLPALSGDLTAIRRVAREFVEDCSRELVAYCEARLCPQLLMPLKMETPPVWAAAADHANDANINGNTNGSQSQDVIAEQIVEAALAGIGEGEKTCPGTKVRLILCCIRGQPKWSAEILQLCEKFKDSGVVGIDIAGSHHTASGGDTHSEGAEVFQEAARRGVHRTVHAGEDAPAASVRAAIDDLKAERIGHGYRVLEDESTYQYCRGTHFEVCPTSSYLTGAISSLQLTSKRHPVLRFIEDDVSFSINRDDPLLTATSLRDEYNLLASWGCSEAVFARANFNAALHSFLPPAEKRELLRQLRDAYGVPDVDVRISDGDSGKAANLDKPCITVNTWENRT